MGEDHAHGDMAAKEGDEELERLRATKRANAEASLPGAGGQVHIATDGEFAALLQDNPRLVVDFWAPWCGPCRAVSPIVEELARDYAGTVTFAKLNTDENLAVPNQFNIFSIPTLIAFKDGVAFEQVVGALPKAKLDAFVRRLAAA